MSCERYLHLIDDLVEGELDEQIAARVDSHVLTCLNCRQQLEAVKREKSVYARYLFDAEPPIDLWANFQTRLNAEKIKNPHPAKIPANVSARKTNVFSFWRFSPLLAGASLMIVFGIGYGWLKFAADVTNKDIEIAKTESGDLRLPPTFDETGKSKTADLQLEINRGEKNAALQNSKLSGKDKSSKIAIGSVADNKSPLAESAKIKQKIAFARVGRKKTTIGNRSDEEARQELQMKTLENEIAGQIEKVELLLRSFRNARASETIETFDVEYEKGQARKLLEKNVRLRRNAESYGIFDAEELLNRVEPYLLDIANLADNPAPDKVLDIRERVKNQSIIASLQIY